MSMETQCFYSIQSGDGEGSYACFKDRGHKDNHATHGNGNSDDKSQKRWYLDEGRIQRQFIDDNEELFKAWRKGRGI